MRNLAGQSKEMCDEVCRRELEQAGIPVFPFRLLQAGEVKTDIFGWFEKRGWIVKRAWRYWVAEWKPPYKPMTMATAKRLFETHGQVARAGGDCACRPPETWFGEDGVPYCYHIDTQDGLAAFAKAVEE